MASDNTTHWWKKFSSTYSQTNFKFMLLAFFFKKKQPQQDELQLRKTGQIISIGS